jgi:ankyrin repeat protein
VDGNTALHVALISGSTAVVKALIRNGAPLHVRNRSRKTAMDLAVESMTTKDFIKVCGG